MCVQHVLVATLAESLTSQHGSVSASGVVIGVVHALKHMVEHF